MLLDRPPHYRYSDHSSLLPFLVAAVRRHHSFSPFLVAAIPRRRRSSLPPFLVAAVPHATFIIEADPRRLSSHNCHWFVKRLRQSAVFVELGDRGALLVAKGAYRRGQRSGDPSAGPIWVVCTPLSRLVFSAKERQKGHSGGGPNPRGGAPAQPSGPGARVPENVV